MAENREKRRCVAASAASKGGDGAFLTRCGASALLRGAVLKMVEARTDDPIGFLADHFCHLAAGTEAGTEAGTGGGTEAGTGTGTEAAEVDDASSGTPGGHAHEQQRLNRALWHLRLAHHSHHSAFSNNVRVAYELLDNRTPDAGAAPGGGGVRGSLYTQTLQCLCSEGGVPASTSAPLLRRLHCHAHEAVPYDMFRHAVLTCAVFSDYIRQAQRLYADVCCPDQGPVSRALGAAVIRTLEEALETSHGGEADRDGNANAESRAVCCLEASAKLSPDKLAQAMAEAHGRGPGGTMDAKEFENAAAEVFITRVKVMS